MMAWYRTYWEGNALEIDVEKRNGFKYFYFHRISRVCTIGIESVVNKLFVIFSTLNIPP